MTLWLTAVTPTFSPARTSAQMTCAPVYVFPVPGGPWMASTPPSRASAMRHAASTVFSPGRRRLVPSSLMGGGLRRISSTAAWYGSRGENPRLRTASPNRMRDCRSVSEGTLLWNTTSVGYLARRLDHLLDIDGALGVADGVDLADPVAVAIEDVVLFARPPCGLGLVVPDRGEDGQHVGRGHLGHGHRPDARERIGAQTARPVPRVLGIAPAGALLRQHLAGGLLDRGRALAVARLAYEVGRGATYCGWPFQARCARRGSSLSSFARVPIVID